VRNRLIAKLKNKGRQILAPALFYAGYYDYLFSSVQNKAVILMYHRISNFAQGNEFYSGFEIGVSKDNFDNQMKYIRENMNPMPLPDLMRCIATTRTIPKRAVAVTFDDGYEDNYTHAYPILKQYSMPATIFVTSGFIESSRIFWWDKIGQIVKRTTVPFLDTTILYRRFSRDWIYPLQKIPLSLPKERERAISLLVTNLKTFDRDRLKEAVNVLQDNLKINDHDLSTTQDRVLTWAQILEMSKSDIVEFGAHTVSHPNLAQIGDDEVKKEIQTSKRILEDGINKPVQGFAYPYGFSQDYNETIKKVVIDTGFTYACTAASGVVCPENDCYELKRISMSNTSISLSLWKMSKYL